MAKTNSEILQSIMEVVKQAESQADLLTKVYWLGYADSLENSKKIINETINKTFNGVSE